MIWFKKLPLNGFIIIVLTLFLCHIPSRERKCHGNDFYKICMQWNVLLFWTYLKMCFFLLIFVTLSYCFFSLLVNSVLISLKEGKENKERYHFGGINNYCTSCTIWKMKSTIWFSKFRKNFARSFRMLGRRIFSTNNFFPQN